MDLFNKIESLPENVKEILDLYEDAEDYPQLEDLKNDLEKIGYTVSYGLDAIPYNLRKLKIRGTKH
jgi:hypothetical protein